MISRILIICNNKRQGSDPQVYNGAYDNAQHQAFTQQTGRKRVLPGNIGRGFNAGETQTKGHTVYWTKDVWVSGN